MQHPHRSPAESPAPERPALVALSRPYVAREGAPIIVCVDPAIWARRYFAACLSCGYCRDWCCSFGVDLDAANAERILAQADALEPVVGVPRALWFDPSEEGDDPDMPGGRALRTRAVDGACVFLNRAGRGCLLHAHALATGQDYHAIKPMVSSLFPVTFGGGVLCLADELDDGTLVCADSARPDEGAAYPTAYDAVRGELEYYFGAEFVAELDGLRAAAGR